ncbi:DUF6443 domain-containing protein, partial [Acinetobacter baumannii]
MKADPFTDQANFYSGTYANSGNQPALSGEQYYYSHIQFEPSPLNRTVKTFAPGNSWAGSENSSNTSSEHAIQSIYSY